MLWWLIIGHFVIDYPLQGDTTAREKNYKSTTELQKYVPWYYWMLAHSLMHGGFVSLVTGSFWLGFFETVVHFLTDLGKCANIYSIHTDQLIHLACKIIWVYIYYA